MSRCVQTYFTSKEGQWFLSYSRSERAKLAAKDLFPLYYACQDRFMLVSIASEDRCFLKEYFSRTDLPVQSRFYL